MSKQDEIYLCKQGKTFGPYSQKEIDQFHETGEILEFNWIWDEEKDDWKAIAPPPPKPGKHPSLSSSQNFDTSSRPKQSQDVQNTDIHGIRVICHNHQIAISCDIKSMTETGCRLASKESSTSPSLSEKAPVLLNLFNPDSGKSVNVKAKVLKVFRELNQWEYQIRWDRCPSL